MPKSSSAFIVFGSVGERKNSGNAEFSLAMNSVGVRSSIFSDCCDNPSFVSRILRLAYLSPTLVEAILDGKYPAHLTMKDLMEPFPMEWRRQDEHFFCRGSAVQGG